MLAEEILTLDDLKNASPEPLTRMKAALKKRLRR